MKKNLRFLNKKHIKEILGLIKKQWSADAELDYVVVMNEEGKIYLVNREIADVPLDNLRIDSLGSYFGQLKNNTLRLSIEGSQIIGTKAKKNVYNMTDDETKRWIMGEDLATNESSEEFVLMKHNNDFLGTGKIKEGKVLNFVPKGRRLKVVV